MKMSEEDALAKFEGLSEKETTMKKEQDAGTFVPPELRNTEAAHLTPSYGQTSQGDDAEEAKEKLEAQKKAQKEA